MSALTYAIVTPARNERDNLRRLADSVMAQDHAAVSWVIVDDGSDDGMREVADDLALQHDWILVVGTAEDAGDLAMGRLRGRDLLAFRRGLSSLPSPVDVFVKVDADTSFEPDYFATLLDRFAAQPDLGIAGGTCYEVVDGEWQRMKVSGSHPRGASRAYRWDLLDDVFALEPEMGWDGVDEVMAELRGYRTAGFTDFGFRHHRKVGERDGRLRAGSPLGTTGLVHGLPAKLSCASGHLPSSGEPRLTRDGLGLCLGGGQRRSAVPESHGHPSRSPGSAYACRHATRRLGLANSGPPRRVASARVPKGLTLHSSPNRHRGIFGGDRSLSAREAFLERENDSADWHRCPSPRDGGRRRAQPGSGEARTGT